MNGEKRQQHQQLKKRNYSQVENNKRSISQKEKQELIEYYQHSKVSEYSQQSLQPKDDINYDKKVLPKLNATEKKRLQDISKSLLNVSLKKELNLFGLGESSEKQLSMFNNNDYSQRPFSSKYFMRLSKDKYNFNQFIKNSNNFRDTKSTNKICNQTFDNISQSFENINNNNPTLNGLNLIDSVSNSFFLKCNYQKNNPFVSRRYSYIPKIENQQQSQQKTILINGDRSKSCNKASALNSFINNDEFASNIKLNNSKQTIINKPNYYETSELFNKQFFSTNYQEKDNKNSDIQIKSQEKNNKTYNSFGKYAKRNSCLIVFDSDKKQRLSQQLNENISHLIKKPEYFNQKYQHKNGINTNRSEYIRFQNQILNGIFVQQGQKEYDAQKDVIMKYFNFPKDINISDNQLSKLEQSKLVLETYLNNKSLQFIAEKVKDSSLLSVLQKVKTNIVNKEMKQENKNKQISSKLNSPRSSSQPQNKQETDQNYNTYFNKFSQRSSSQLEFLSKLVDYEGELTEDFNQSQIIDTQQIKNQNMQDCYSEYFLFNRNKSFGKDDTKKQIKQQQKNQFNNLFDAEMIKIRNKERLLLNDKNKKILPYNQQYSQFNQSADILIQNINSIIDISENANKINENNDRINDNSQIMNQDSIIIQNQSKELSSKKCSPYTKRIINLPNPQNKLRKLQFYKSKEFFGRQNEVSSINLPQIDKNQQIKIQEQRVKKEYNDNHLNENYNLNNSSEKEKIQHQNSFEESTEIKQKSFRKSKENISNQKLKIRSTSTNNNYKQILEEINILKILSKAYAKEQEQLSQDKINSSFEQYKPSTNHLTNCKKLYKKQRKQNKDIQNSQSLQNSPKYPKQEECNLKIDPQYLYVQNQKHERQNQVITNRKESH